MKATVALVSTLFAVASAARAAPAPAGVPSTFVFEEVCSLGPLENLGDTPLGHRQRIPITGGSFSGPGMNGTILAGGADLQLKRADGVLVIDADYLIRTDDGTIIHVHNVGAVPPATPGERFSAWAAPVFEAPMGRYGWLNGGIYVSRIGTAGDAQHPAVRITVFRIAAPKSS